MFDWLIGFLITYNKKKQLRRDEELFIFKMKQLLQSSDSWDNKIDKTKDLCRMTEGKMSAGVYFVLNNIKKYKDEK